MSNKKILYIANRFDSVPAGGTQIARSHYEILRNMGDVFVLSLLSKNQEENPELEKVSIPGWRSSVSTVISIFAGRRTIADYYCIEAENDIIRIIREGSYDLIWFDDCLYGSTIRKIKQIRPEIPVFAFWHIVLSWTLSRVIMRNMCKTRNIFHTLMHVNYVRQQKLSARYADVNVLLNERDRRTFTELYGQREQLILPTCFIDTAHIEPTEKIPEEFNIFFIGLGGHSPNMEGIRWFAREVMPGLRAEARLSIVGTNMDKFLKDAPEIKDNPRISLRGRVDSLDSYYNSSDVVVVPIFSGAGMMTKVAEALMYGKNILATGHALNGYEDLSECKCDTAGDFITRINSMIETGTERFNPAMRKIYEAKYSLSAMESILRECFRKKGI